MGWDEGMMWERGEGGQRGEGVKPGREERGNTVLEGKEREREKSSGGNQRKRQRLSGTDFTLACPSTVVWYEPSATGVRLGRAHLTGVTPRTSHCGAAQCLCAHNASELTLTHLVIHRGEARPSSVVCRGEKASQGGSVTGTRTQRDTSSLSSGYRVSLQGKMGQIPLRSVVCWFALIFLIHYLGNRSSSLRPADLDWQGVPLEHSWWFPATAD